MGVALDTDPNLLIWLLLDTIVALIFVAEAGFPLGGAKKDAEQVELHLTWHALV